MWNRKQQLELDMEQLIGSKLGKEYDKAVYYLPACLTYMQNTSCKATNMNLTKLRKAVKDRRAWPALFHGVMKSKT